MTFYIKPEYAPRADGMYVFEKDVLFEKNCECVLSVFAVSRYILYVNGQYVCEGPCRSHEQVRYYDSLSYNFSKGSNHIEFRVMHTTTYFTSVYDAPTPQLAFEAKCGGEVVIETDKSFGCRFLSSYTLTRHGMHSLPPYEFVDMHKADIPLAVVEGDRAFFQPNGFFTGGGAAYPYILEHRPIPMIFPEEKRSMRVVRKGKNYIELDAGMYTTSRLSLKLRSNQSIKIIYAECYSFEDGKHKRDDESGCLKGYFDTVVSSEKDMEFQTFWFRSFRYIRIEGDAEGVFDIFLERITYPLDIKGNFHCSDEEMNRMYEVSKNTIFACCHDIISDCPYYEQQQYEFDCMVQIAVITALTDDMRLIKKCISEFARSQQTCGLLLSIYPASWARQIIPSYSLAWIMMLRLYYEKTKDKAFVSLYTGVIDGILGFFDRQIKEKGYLSNTRYWDFFDWVPEWKNGTMPVKDNEVHTLYHFYYAIALMDAAFLAREIDRTSLAEEYLMRKRSVLDIAIRSCFHEDVGMYFDGSDSHTFSMHTSIFAILADAYDQKSLPMLLSSLSRKDICQSGFSLNYLLFRALEKCNRYDLAFRFFDGWRKMLANGCTSWCENPDDPRSECHGWSSTPIYEFSRHVLGVSVGVEEEINIKPITGSLTYAEGCVPTRFGEVFIRWKKENSGFCILIRSKRGVKKHLYLFGNKEYVFDKEEAEYFVRDDEINV